MMRPMGLGQIDQIGGTRASASGSPRSIAPRRSPWRWQRPKLTREFRRRKPAFFNASPNEPPISPTPTIATVCNSDTPPHRRSNQAKLAIQIAELLREQGLRAVAEGVGRDRDGLRSAARRAGGHRGARHGTTLSRRPVPCDGSPTWAGARASDHRDGGNIHVVLRV